MKSVGGMGDHFTNLKNSDGLKKQPRKVVSLEESPKRVKEVYETIRPHYEHLESHRIILKNE